MARLQVDDAEPPDAQRQSRGARFINQEAFIVRPAVPHGSGHSPHSRFRFGSTPGKSDSADATHALLDLRRAKENRSSPQEPRPQLKSWDVQPVVRIPTQQNSKQQKKQERGGRRAQNKKRLAFQKQRPVKLFFPIRQSGIQNPLQRKP